MAGGYFVTGFGTTYFGGNASSLADYGLGALTPYIGCMREVVVDTEVIIPGHYLEGDSSSELVVGCARTDQCQPDPCNSQGHCQDRWFDFQCHCHRPYLGDACQESKYTWFLSCSNPT